MDNYSQVAPRLNQTSTRKYSSGPIDTCGNNGNLFIKSKYQKCTFNFIVMFGKCIFRASPLRINEESNFISCHAIFGLIQNFFSRGDLAARDRHGSTEPGQPAEDGNVENLFFHNGGCLIHRHQKRDIDKTLMIAHIETIGRCALKCFCAKVFLDVEIGVAAIAKQQF